MDYSKATNKQLKCIADSDNNCPTNLLGGAVIEMLNRGLFDKLIGGCIKNRFRDTDILNQTYGLSVDDLMQVGRMEVLKGVEKYKPDKYSSYSSFCWVRIKDQLLKELEYVRAQKRDTKDTLSYNVKTEEGTEIGDLFDDRKQNVEKYVVNKVTIEQLLERVNEHQRKVIEYRLQGYTFEEISKLMGSGCDRTMHQAYTRAIEKMRKGA